MSDNPYAPPRAAVDDITPEEPPRRRPVQVTVAVVLLWIMLCVAVLSLASSWRNLVAIAPAVMTVLLVVMIALIALLNVGILKGWNWSRIVYLVLVLIGLPRFVTSIQAVFEVSPILGLVGVVQNAMQVAAMYLVFLSPGRVWFRR